MKKETGKKMKKDTVKQSLTVRKMDRILSFPAISFRIFGDRSGVSIDVGFAPAGKISRNKAAELLRELRKQLKENNK